ncbi:DUF2442 domain-containing protein, partial [Nostoc sp. 'Peltigera malacea cyanobiont' DB3992]|uniref:DUF2442 domain-containing protein n=1 Tax=Nostoc sp. 'Peltigera malacea cyanobiont' DB3992 TaxID=1206980 RepID=UPI000C040178
MVKKIAATEELKEKLANARAKSDAIATSELRATRAFYDAYLGMIIVFLSNKCMFGFPSELGEGLAGASVKDLAEVEVTPSGKGLHWKTLDVDLSIPALMNGIFGTKNGWLNLRERVEILIVVTTTNAPTAAISKA